MSVIQNKNNACIEKEMSILFLEFTQYISGQMTDFILLSILKIHLFFRFSPFFLGRLFFPPPYDAFLFNGSSLRDWLAVNCIDWSRSTVGV